ncbi:MAG TPA: hypothetical protein VJ810_34185 [Blastocatellia bacterium]|nr:hypothetical protein [Blastocatellia bacterium]
MSDETGKTSATRNYLLGDLPESAAEEFERRYFADGQRVDEVWAVFGEMAEESLSGELSDSESRRFGQRLRSAPFLREMFENEKALYNRAARTASGTSHRAAIDNSISEVGWRRSARVGSLKVSRLAVAAVLVLTALIAWFALRTREGAISVSPEGSRQTTMKDQQPPGGIAQPPVDPQRSPPSGRDPNDNRSEEKNSPKASPPGQGRPASRIDQQVTATFLLSRPRVREEQNDPTLEITVQTGAVQLELELSNDGCAVYSATLFEESGVALQRWERLRARRDHSIPRVVLRAPADSLKNASYVIRLDCSSHSVPAEQYRFKVEKK